MTTVLDDVRDMAQTHVLVIGVGAYRHLKGGSSTLLAEHMGLGQLSSPPISAKAVADWMLSHFDNQRAPLGSLEMVVSPSIEYLNPKNNSVTTIDAAFKRNIETAFDNWLTRCNGNENNVAIFYYCGHGVQRENLLLLAEDFGEVSHRKFENSFDFHKTYQGMAQCRAGVQCYFVDSCRQVASEMLEEIEIDSLPLIGGKVRNNYYREAPILYASSPDGRAYARPGKETRFARALLQGLKGLGSKPYNGLWVVTPSSLGNAVKRIIDRENRNPRVPSQQCKPEGDFSDAPIHFLPGPPKIPITLGCAPSTATRFARLSIVSRRDPTTTYSRKPSPQEWEVEIPADRYQVGARFDTGGYRDSDKEIWVITPYEVFELEVGP